MTRSKVPYFFLALAAVLAVSALILLIVRPGVHPDTAPPVPPAGATGDSSGTEPTAGTKPQATDPSDTAPPPATTPVKPIPGHNPAKDPTELVNRIAKAFEAGDLATLDRLIGKEAMDPQAAQRFKELAASKPRLRPLNGSGEVGEIELNARSRWALELDGQEPGRDRIFLDLRRDGSKWVVDKITMPPAPGEPIPKAMLADSLGVADAFLQAVLKQDFEFARGFVDSATVSDAKIAGLCILFEEGNYQLRKTKPLRAMFQRQDTVGYLANVATHDGNQSAQFAITLKQPSAAANWVVSEINLDQLLADYARRVAGGDVYYSPLVKNPAGGDTLALYFEFDEDMMNPRTSRQLEIVSRILKTDPDKKLTLSGHTDALGSDPYNNKLSARRAEAVREFLIHAGVSANQIISVAKGASQPRRPNLTESGADNPEGRRANRRTEIYLDF